MAARIRLYIDKEIKQNQYIVFDLDHRHYLGNVMRLKIGDQLQVFNERDGEWLVQIDAVQKKEMRALVKLQLVKSKEEDAIVENRVILGLPVIKSHNFSLALQKAAEFRVFAIQPIVFDYSTIEKVNFVRSERILIEATEQCGGISVPQILPQKNLRQFLLDAMSKDAMSKKKKCQNKNKKLQTQVFVAITDQNAKFLKKNFLSSSHGEFDFSAQSLFKKLYGSSANDGSQVKGSKAAATPSKSIFLCAGPEGGFSKEEIQVIGRYFACSIQNVKENVDSIKLEGDLNENHEFFCVNICDSILRSETAIFSLLTIGRLVP